MPRFIIFFLISFMLGLCWLRADEDGPPISITAPEQATTFAQAELKNRALSWDKQKNLLVANISFIEVNPNNTSGQPEDDSHTFTFPGVTLDAKQGIFYASTKTGEQIPVAKLKKILFITEISILPNAQIRVQYPHGDITVILEAIRPDDPALKAPGNTNTDQSMNLNKLF